MTARRKAPTVRATGCPVCKKLGIPGTSCAVCVEAAHGAWLRRVRAAQLEGLARFGPGCDVAEMLLDELERALAGWVGACLLLDELGVLLVRVGFEVPADVARDVRR